MTDTNNPSPQPIALPGRALLRLASPDGLAAVKNFLNGLISNDTGRIGADRALYAALLSPQGKFLFDMFVAEWQDALWLDVAADRAEELARKLALYRLRAKISIDLQAGWQAFALIGGAGLDSAPGLAAGFGFTDPRLAGLGARLWLPPGAAPSQGEPGDFAAYEKLRIGLGVPDGAQDIEIDKGLLLEHHFEALHGVDFRKGCYVGQELTARTKYRGLVKKQLFQVRGSAALPAAGSQITLDGQEAGWLRSSQGQDGLALLRLEAAAKAAAGDRALLCDGIALEARLPDYAAQPESE